MSELKSAKENREDYAKKREEILSLLRNAADYYNAAKGEEAKAEAFEKLAQDLENGEFSIVVVGEFSAGKSTLLNALMGERILPSFTNETTATVNFLRHSEKAENGEAGRVYYYDGRQVPLENATLETIDQFVSTKGDDVAQKVQHLDLYLDSDFLKDGVTLVDSPGLNGVADGHREITEAQILRSHASIFVFNSDHPGSKTDFEFLYDLQKKVKTIIFVLNKVDSIKEDEGETVESVIESLKANYRKQFPEQKEVPEIWPVAAYPALVARNKESMEYHGKKEWSPEEKAGLEKASRMTAFENRLIQFLTCGEKTHNQLLEPVNRVISIASESRSSYESEIKVLEERPDTGEIDNQIVETKELIAGLEARIEEKEKVIFEQTDTILREVREELNTNLIKYQERNLKEIDEFDNVDELMDYLEKFESRFVQKVSSYARDADKSLRRKIISIIGIQYAQITSDLEQQLAGADHVVKLELTDHLEMEKLPEVGLDKMEEKQKQYEEEYKRLNEKANSLGMDYQKSRDIERKKEKLNLKIKDLKESRDIIQTQILPPVEYYTEKETIREERKGVFGAVVQFFAGGKRVERDVRKTDSSEHDKAAQDREAQISDLNKEIDASMKAHDGLEDVNPDMAEYNWMMAKEEASEARKALKEVIDSNTKEIEDKYKRYIRKTKRKLRDYCDAVTDYMDEKLKDELDGCKKNYVQLINVSLESSIRKGIERNQEKLEALQKQLQASEEDRNSRMAELQDKIERINKLLEAAAEQQADLEQAEIATVEYTAL